MEGGKRKRSADCVEGRIGLIVKGCDRVKAKESIEFVLVGAVGRKGFEQASGSGFDKCHDITRAIIPATLYLQFPCSFTTPRDGPRPLFYQRPSRIKHSLSTFVVGNFSVLYIISKECWRINYQFKKELQISKSLVGSLVKSVPGRGKGRIESKVGQVKGSKK